MSRKHAEWPLMVFTLALQMATGIAIAATLVARSASLSQIALFRDYGMLIFPVIAGGLLISTMHLGRPLEAWRATSNLRQSRLSREVMLTLLFGIAGAACSASWWVGGPWLRFFASAATAMLGIAAVVASAAIYKLPSKPAWNSGWVLLSFLGSTVAISGIPLLLLDEYSRQGIFLAGAGSALLLVASAWMWVRSLREPKEPAGVSMWMLVHLAALFLSFLSVYSSTARGVFTLWLAGLILAAVVTGRMLMFKLESLSPGF